MIKSTYKTKIIKKEAELLIEKLKEFELAYFLGWRKLNVSHYRDPVLEELVSLINKISGKELLQIKTEQPEAEKGVKPKIKRLF
jgi:hypothetical protein